ncbi:beta-propeller fold lactonase family protein [Marinobacter xestospongiae]|uniref:beta-propeller fold lactonase family protein n=1 Tax=Marinobacter xestospongiae TaxID=994319 RepID=UPI002005DDC1|nr:beta-propeller fold lactonase family protein [Marinobacter xestospongiae]MCK7568202.1 beta-propeller fold lactonase family protein [Marinobacter xestospongiae]
MSGSNIPMEKSSRYRANLLCVLGMAAFSAMPAAAEPFKEMQWIQDGVNGIDTMRCSQNSATSPDLRFVYSIAYCDNALNVFSRDIETGSLNLVDSLIANKETGVGLRPEDEVIMSPDGKYVYVMGMTGKPGDSSNNFRSALFVYERDLDTGYLTERQIYDGQGLTSPVHAQISQDGQYIYVASNQTKSVAVLKRTANGLLSEVQFNNELTAEERYFDVPAMALSPDENQLFVSVGSDHFGAIVTMSRDATTGKLTYVGEVSSKTAGTTDLRRIDELAVSNDGDYLYAFNDSTLSSDGTELWQFDVLDDGSLSFVDTATIPDNHPDEKFFCPTSLNISSNDHLLYFVDHCGGTFQLWNTSDVDGSLTFLAAEEEDNRRTLSQVPTIEITPDERFAHVPSPYGLSVFELSADTDLTLSAASTATPSEEFAVDLDLINLGGASAHGVEVHVQTGESLTFVSADPFSNTTTCTAVAQGVTCNVGRLQNGEAEEIRLTLRAPEEAGEVTLAALVTQFEIDPDESNNENAIAIEVGGTPADNSGDNDNGNTDDSDGGGGSSGLGFLAMLTALACLRRPRQVRSRT